MAWIELHQTIWTHRKTIMLAALLDIDEMYAAAHMIRLWTWALDNAQDGDLSGLPHKVIAFGAGWKGDPDAFVHAAIQAGWIDQEGDRLVLHDWYDYAGRLIEKREANKERARKSRERNAQRARNVRATNEDVAQLPNHTKPNDDDDDVNTHARDEKFALAYRTFEQHFGLMNPTQRGILEECVDAGMEPEVFEAAAQETRKRGFAADYFFGIIEKCVKRGILTLQAFREDQVRFEQKKASQSRAGPVNRLQMANESLIRSIMEAEERDRSRSPEAVSAHPERV